ncbi:MAG: hypothetical protein ABIR77_01930 [Sphingomicrobium sp.]
MRPVLMALLAAPALAGCATTAPTTAATNQAYRALGTEPFWSLSIDARSMRFSTADGQAVNEPTPRVIHGFAGEIYQGKHIRVNIVHGKCSDGMSDRIYPDSVQLGVDGMSFRGCGGL